jgi:glutamate racemase
VKRSYTRELIARFANECRLRCWVPLSWWNWQKPKLVAKQFLLEELRRILRPWLPEPPDTVVLGCTHFLYYRKSFTGPAEGTRLVDSGAAIAPNGLVIRT